MSLLLWTGAKLAKVLPKTECIHLMTANGALQSV